MVNILLSTNRFDHVGVRRKLKRFIRRRKRVLIIPLAHHEDYVNDAESFRENINKSHHDIQDIIESFGTYGIHSKNIHILNCYGDSEELVRNKFKRADILFFMGGYPDKLMARVDKFNLRKHIEEFDGIVMGASAGAMVQFDKFHVTPEEDGQEFYYCDGLGLISGFDVEVHYRDRQVQVDSIYRDLEERGIPIIMIPDGSGAIIYKGEKIMLGQSFVVDKSDTEIFQMFSEDKFMSSLMGL